METRQTPYANGSAEGLRCRRLAQVRDRDGRGIASRLALHVIEDARTRKLLILPVCPFFSAYFQKHPEHADVVHPTYRGILGV